MMVTPAAPSLRLEPRPKYLSLALAAAQRAIAYRGSTLLNLSANLVWAVALYYIWQTVFAANPKIGSFDWGRMRTYILVSYAVNQLLSFSSASRMMATIRTGEIANELIRPVDCLKAQLAQALGAAVIEGFLSSSIAILLGLLLLEAAPPYSSMAVSLFLLSVCLGFLIKFLISFIVALLCFWTLNSTGLLWAQTAVVNVFSGALIPLQFFPGWLKAIALGSPFQAIIHTPLAIYLGDVQSIALGQALAIQAVWVVVLWLLARLLWIPSIRALTVQGG